MEYGYRPPNAPQHAPPVFPNLDVGDVFQTSSNIVGSNFIAFVAVAAMFALPGTVASSILGAFQLEAQANMQAAMMGGNWESVFDNFPVGIWLGQIAVGLLNALLVYLGMGSLMYASVEHLAGRKASVGDVISRGLSSVLPIAGVALLLTIAQFVAIIPGAVAMVVSAFAAASMEAPALMCCAGPVGIALVFVPMVYISIIFFLSIPAAVVERTGTIKAMERSLELTKGHRGTIFLVLFLLVLVLIVIVVASSCCIGGATAGAIDPSTMQMQEVGFFSLAFNFIVGLAMQMLRIMVIGAIAAVIYARVRGLKDGVDANSIAQVFS